jgi:hypothetical protein
MTFYDGLLYIWTVIAITITMLFTMIAIGCATKEVCKPISLDVSGVPFTGQWCEKRE